MSRVLIKGGRVVDPSQDVDREMDLLISDGKVVELGEGLSEEDAKVIDATGLVVAPGFVDLHAHLCEPGREHRETIATGARAAAAGGYTTICAMPTTDPVVDDPAAVGFAVAEGLKARAARVHPAATLSVDRKGESLAEFGELIDAGAVAFADAGVAVKSTSLMRLALEYAQTFDVPILSHSEDSALSSGGVMHEGVVSARLGLQGNPGASEAIGIARDIALAQMTGGRLHIQRVTTAAGVHLIRQGKEQGVRVTAEATPHHLTLTHEAVDRYGTEFKVDPPLRPKSDVEALRAGLAEGVIDAVATDHAPCHYDEKEAAFGDAPSGAVGFETAFAVLHTRLTLEGRLDLPTLLYRMSTGPARVLGLPGGTLGLGQPGDITLIDLGAEWTVEPKALLSKSRNTPFGGWELTGRVVHTLVDGEAVWVLP